MLYKLHMTISNSSILLIYKFKSISTFETGEITMADIKLYRGESLKTVDGVMVFRSHYLNFTYTIGELIIEDPYSLTNDYRKLMLRFKHTAIPEAIKEKNGKIKVSFAFSKISMDERKLDLLLEDPVNEGFPVLLEPTKFQYDGQGMAQVVDGKIITHDSVLDFRMKLDRKKLYITAWFKEEHADDLAALEAVVTAMEEMQ